MSVENIPGIPEKLVKAKQKEDKRRRKTSKKFDPKKILNDQQLIIVTDDELGEISFGKLTVAEGLQINAIEDPDEKILQALHFMLQKAYPNLTLDEVKAQPIDVGSKLIQITFRYMSFLPATKPLENG